MKALLLAANPIESKMLALDKELREIERKLWESENRGAIEIVAKLAVQTRTVLDFFTRHQPEIAQFSSHGTASADILLLDEYDSPQPIAPSAIADLFATVRVIRLVIFNVCHSLPHAQAVTRSVDCAIGMEGEMGDAAAIEFSSEFYRGLADRRSVAEAFQWAVTQVSLTHPDFRDVPKLCVREGVTASNVVLVADRASDGPPRNDLSVSASGLPKTMESALFGRDVELAFLDRAWHKKTVNIVTIVAFGGVGKSTLIKHWLAGLAQAGYQGATTVYAWSFYRQGTTTGIASADEFVEAALKWFGDDQPAKGSGWEKGLRLAKLVQKQRAILLLDGLEPLQNPPGPNAGYLKDAALGVFIREIAAQNPGLCVITTRHMVSDISSWNEKTVKVLDLERLSPEAGEELMRSLGVIGLADKLQAASEEFDGHALTLTLLGTYLKERVGGDIDRRNDPEILRELLDEDLERGGYARRIMHSYVLWFGEESAESALLLMLGLFDRPIADECLRELRHDASIREFSVAGSCSEGDWARVKERLVKARMIVRDTEGISEHIDTHPLIREYFARVFSTKSPASWRQAHKTLFDYFNNSVGNVGPLSMTELEFLLQAVHHGCKSGRHHEALQEVYIKKVMRGTEFYAAHRLLAFGRLLSSLSSFFAGGIWSRPVEPSPPDIQGLTPEDQLYVLTQAAVFLINQRGYGVSEVADTYKKAMSVATQKGIGSTELFQAHRGMSLYYIARGLYENAVEEGDRLAALAAEHPDDARLAVEARFSQGIPLLYMGEVDKSLTFMLQGKELYNADIHHANAFLFGHDPGIACRCFAGWAYGLLGQPDAALREVSDALALAERLNDPFGRVFALYCSVIVRRIRREIKEAAELVERLVQEAEKGSYAYWLAGANIYRGWIRAESGELKGGLDHMRRGLVAWRATGADMALSYWSVLISHVLIKGQRYQEAREQLDIGYRSVVEMGEQYYEAEIWRLRGEIASAEGDHNTARTHLGRAISLAQRGRLRWFELCSLTTLCGMPNATSKDRTQLAEVYESITEGRTTQDMVRAVELL